MDRYTLNQDETALMIIDIQERLAPAIFEQAGVIDRTLILTQAAAEMNLPVILTEQNPRGLGLTVSLIRELLAERLPAVKPFEKMIFSAYTEEVAAALAATGRKKVIITGMETHICVLRTVRGLLADGYQVFVARDAVSSRTAENRENGLQQMAAMGAVISNSETILFDLVSVAGTPLFKKILKLIK